MITRIWRRRLVILAWAGFVGLIVVAALVWIAGDRWWLALPFLYGPRLLAGVLIAPILLLAFTFRSRGPVLGLLATLVLFGYGILGFRFNIFRGTSIGNSNIRIVSYNVAGRVIAAERLMDALDSLQVDLAAVVECPGGIAPPGGWHLSRLGEICLLGRDSLPDLTPPSEQSEDGAAIARVDIIFRGVPLRFGLVHLGTPHGIAMMFNDKSEILKLGPMVRESTRQRARDSEIAARFFEENAGMHVLVAGDFNLPVESAIYREYWGRYSNSFDQAGRGLGSSWVASVYRIRIDHILSTGSIRAVRSWVGPDWGSDHLPIFADLKLPESS